MNNTTRKISRLIEILHTFNIENKIKPEYRVEIQKVASINKTLDTWEIRAFATCIIIVLTTACLTFPFVCTFFIDMHLSNVVSRETRMILFGPLVINSVVKPFIYAWRIPEIQQEFKKYFRRTA